MSTLGEARTASNIAADTRHTLEKLIGMGFEDDAFKILHHFEDESIKSFLKFTHSLKRGAFHVEGNNHRVHQRLMYVLVLCPNGAPPRGKNFSDLAHEALSEIPPIPPSRKAPAQH